MPRREYLMSQISLGAIDVEVVLKSIKHLHLRVRPPTGRVCISAPRRTSLATIRSFALSKLQWIRQQQARMREQEREVPREYVDEESHYVWGKRHVLAVLEWEGAPAIELSHGRLILRVRPWTALEVKRALVGEWYRAQLSAAVPSLLARWQPLIGVKVDRFTVRQMTSRWGSCNYRTHTIRLSADLARKPPECLEYVVVHELVHLLEPTHNARFAALMDRFLPNWRSQRRVLNRAPAREEARRVEVGLMTEEGGASRLAQAAAVAANCSASPSSQCASRRRTR
jgi:predicted metal-dependent hydrolase